MHTFVAHTHTSICILFKITYNHAYRYILTHTCPGEKNRFVTFSTEEATKQALDAVKPLKWAGKTVGVAIKSESLLKGITPGSPPKGALNISANASYYVPMHYNPNGQYSNYSSFNTQNSNADGNQNGYRQRSGSGRRGPGGPGAVNSNGGGVPNGAEAGNEGSSRRGPGGGSKKNKGGRGSGSGGGRDSGREGGSPQRTNDSSAAQQPPINMEDFPELETKAAGTGTKKSSGGTSPIAGAKDETTQKTSAAVLASADAAKKVVKNDNKVMNGTNDSKDANEADAKPIVNNSIITSSGDSGKKKLSYAQMAQITAQASKAGEQ